MARRSWGVRLISGSLPPIGAGTEGGRRRECRRPLVTAGSGSGLLGAVARFPLAAVRSGIRVTPVALTSGGICATPVVLTGGVFSSGVVAAGHGLTAQAVTAGNWFRRAVAGVGDVVGQGLLDAGELVADAGQEREVAAGVAAGAGAVAVGAPGRRVAHRLLVGGDDRAEHQHREAG